jgi:hypothetical protein
MIVRLKKRSAQFPDLTRGNLYNVIGIEAYDLRIMNDHGQPYLYPRALFEVVSAARPREWKTIYGEEGEEYAYPPELSRPGFFESYFDYDRRAIATLRHYLARRAMSRRRVS